MATNSAPLPEWLVIAPDVAGALEKRMSVRQQHFDGLKNMQDTMLMGGAMLDEPIQPDTGLKINGSAMLIAAKTKEEVMERLKKDVYAEQGVWDFSKVQIIPFKCAVRKGL